jgi:hypothetical protein
MVNEMPHTFKEDTSKFFRIPFGGNPCNKVHDKTLAQLHIAS